MKSRTARALLVDLGVHAVEFFEDGTVFQRVIDIGSCKFCKMLRAVLDDRAGSRDCRTLAAIDPVQFIIIFVRKLLFPFALLFFDLLLNENPQSVRIANLLKAGSFVDQRRDADFREGVQKDLGLNGQTLLGRVKLACFAGANYCAADFY